jgi:hypothetical protein
LRDASSSAISPTPRKTADGETKEKIHAVCKNQKQYVDINNKLGILFTWYKQIHVSLSSISEQNLKIQF